MTDKDGSNRQGDLPTELVARLVVSPKGSAELSAHVVKAALAPADTWVEQSRFNGDWFIYERREKPRLWEPCAPLRGASVTESLDAALALAELKLPGWFISLERYSDGWYATVCDHSTSQRRFQGSQRPAALALCIAVLKATTANSVGTERSEVNQNNQVIP